MSRIPISLVSILAVAGVAAVVLHLMGDDALPPLPPATSEVSRGELVGEVSATGTLMPLVSVQVGSQVSGTIHRLHADFNSRVDGGQLIAEIEPSLFNAALAQAEANLKSAKAAHEKAAVLTRDAANQLDRLHKLSDRRVSAQSEIDDARFALEAARAEERAQEAALAQRTAALEQARVNLAHTKIYAPIDGIVMSREVDVGQTVAASLQTPTLFVIAGDLGRMQIETEVDEAFIGKIREGQPVTFSVFAYPERSFEGKLAQVRLNPTVEAGVVKYNCIIHVDNTDLALKPGMTATVAIEVERVENILRVPSSALRFVPDPLPERAKALRRELERHEAIVWVADGNELTPLVVMTGLVGEERTEVEGEGLAEGMRVALPGSGDEREQRGRRRRGLRLF